MIRGMKTNKILHGSGLILGLVIAASSVALADVSQSFNVGGKYHQKHSAFIELPYDEGDISYSLAYEYRDADALWQLACDLTPEFKSRDDLDYGVSPQLNLLLVDRVFQGGVGILSTYTSGEDSGEWMDMYWQFILGLSLPLPGPLTLQVNSYYVFKSWGDVGDFDVGDVEYGAYLGYKF
jgi:hypothetical protein